jgi:hypothetical protein
MVKKRDMKEIKARKPTQLQKTKGVKGKRKGAGGGALPDIRVYGICGCHGRMRVRSTRNTVLVTKGIKLFVQE